MMLRPRDRHGKVVNGDDANAALDVAHETAIEPDLLSGYGML